MGCPSVSVLFNEPKLLKSVLLLRQHSTAARFSALQRAEIAEIPARKRYRITLSRFQCSSASRKFLNYGRDRQLERGAYSFSALQRAENSSIHPLPIHPRAVFGSFQCSSASRKFLNSARYAVPLGRDQTVSVLFSEPKIPQFCRSRRKNGAAAGVSVLFSEPKIPQSP